MTAKLWRCACLAAWGMGEASGPRVARQVWEARKAGSRFEGRRFQQGSAPIASRCDLALRNTIRPASSPWAVMRRRFRCASSAARVVGQKTSPRQVY
jgi:hypothetical protein